MLCAAHPAQPPQEQASHMPFESVYLSLDDQVIVEEGGYMGSLIW